jgi:hypothetical protein
MSNITRYDLIDTYRDGEHECEMQPLKGGRWVSYEDYADKIAETGKVVEILRGEVETLRRRVEAMTRARDAWRDLQRHVMYDGHMLGCDATSKRAGALCTCPARFDEEAEK